MSKENARCVGPVLLAELSHGTRSNTCLGNTKHGNLQEDLAMFDNQIVDIQRVQWVG